MASWTYVTASIVLGTLKKDEECLEILHDLLSKNQYDKGDKQRGRMGTNIQITKIDNWDFENSQYHILIQTKTESLTKKDKAKIINYFSSFIQSLVKEHLYYFVFDSFHVVANCPYWDDGYRMLLTYDDTYMVENQLEDNVKNVYQLYEEQYEDDGELQTVLLKENDYGL